MSNRIIKIRVNAVSITLTNLITRDHLLLPSPRPSAMDSPTALFDSYEQDFQQIIHTISQKLDGDAKDGQGGALRTVVQCTLRRLLTKRRVLSIGVLMALGQIEKCSEASGHLMTRNTESVLRFCGRATEGGAAEGRDGAGRGGRDGTCNVTFIPYNTTMNHSW